MAEMDEGSNFGLTPQKDRLCRYFVINLAAYLIALATSATTNARDNFYNIENKHPKFARERKKLTVFISSGSSCITEAGVRRFRRLLRRLGIVLSLCKLLLQLDILIITNDKMPFPIEFLWVNSQS